MKNLIQNVPFELWFIIAFVVLVILAVVTVLLIKSKLIKRFKRLFLAATQHESPSLHDSRSRSPWDMSASDLQGWAIEERGELAVEVLDLLGCYYFMHVMTNPGTLSPIDPSVPITDQYPSITQNPGLEDARNIWMYFHPTLRSSALIAWKAKQLSRGRSLVDLDLFVYMLERADWYYRITKKKPYPPRVGRISDFTFLPPTRGGATSHPIESHSQK